MITNTHKFILSIIFATFLCHSSYSQEKSRYKCSYQLDMMKDTITLEYFRPEIYIVQIGNNITKGFDYKKFHLDSLNTHNPSLFRELFNASLTEAIETMRRTGSTAHMASNPFAYGPFTSDLYKDYKKNEIRVRDNISIHPFIFKDELKPQDWEILSDTVTILGYPCQKAQCHYKGRDWIAWFTTEIPISEGPWKFYGLPGLIAKLHDTKKQYNFTLIGFQEIEEPIDTKIPKDAQKIDRIEFIKTKMGEEGGKIVENDMTSVGIPTSNSPQKQQKRRDYIELDYK